MSRSENLNFPSESPWNEDAVLDLSVAQIPPEKINKLFLPKRIGFIDVLSTVFFHYIHMNSFECFILKGYVDKINMNL